MDIEAEKTAICVTIVPMQLLPAVLLRKFAVGSGGG